MKKKVRIYKAPDGKGKYLNKTSKFLTKVQMGGTPDPSMLGYPGAQPAQQQDKTNQLIQFVVNDITNQVAKEETLFKLVNIMGVPVDAATELYVTIAEKLTEDIEKEDDRTYEEETGQPRMKENPLTKDAVITENPEQEIDYDLFDDTGSDIVMDDSDQGPDILDEALDPLAEQRYGGATKRRFNDGGQYDVALPDAESYASLVEPMTGYDLVSQMAWNNEEESESPYAQKEYANTTVDYSNLQNGGAYKKAKKKYVSSVMSLLKKQMGGTNESDVDPRQGDPTGANFREGRLKSFTDSVKQTAQMSAMQNQLEQQYDQMMQEGSMLMPEQDVENPMNQTIKAQDGLSVGDNLPRGFYKRSMRRFGNIPNLREVDVRKSGLFGPKQYTMYFDPLPLQQLSNPMAAQIYGYGSGNTAARKQTRTFDAVKTYTNLLEDKVEKEIEKEVKQQVSDEQKEVEVATQQGSTAQASNKRTPVSSGSYATAVVKDKWGRPEGSKYYNFNPDTKQFEGESLPFQRVEGSDFLYGRTPEGQWAYLNPADASYYAVSESSPNMKALKANQSKSASFVTLDSKPGYYYRVRNDGAYVKFKGDPLVHKASTKAVEVITPGDKRHAYMKKNAKASSNVLPQVSFGKPSASSSSNTDGTNMEAFNKIIAEMYGPNSPTYPIYKYPLQQYGGNIDNPFADPLEPLQRFVGGGYDPSIPNPTEDQIQYMDSKDVTDAYMQGGGFIKNFIPANLTRSAQNDVVQRIYNPVTGQTYSQVPANAAGQISAIDVKKRGITGRPKKYTIYYGGAGSMPPKSTTEDKKDGTKKDTKTQELSARQQALENAGYGQRTDVTGLKAKSKRAIKQGERKRDRELEKLYEEDPTSVEFDPMNLDAPADRTAYNNSAYNVNDLIDTTTEEDFATWGEPREAMETLTAYQFPEVDVNDDAGYGLPELPMTQLNAYTFPEEEIDDSASGLPASLREMTSDFGPMSIEGPLATEEDQVPTLEEQYMEGFQPSITQDMIDEASGLRLPQQPVDMGAWSGMSYPGMPIEPGVNPFDLPVGGGEEYYPPFAQPTANVPSRPSLDQLRAQYRNNPNAGKKYTYNVNTSGMKEDPDYKKAIQRAGRDGMVTVEEFENAAKMFKSKQAQQEKDKWATAAQRTINQIMNSSASSAEKNAAREKVLVQMQQRWDEIDRAVNSRKYGGALSRFVGGGSQSFTGENPVGYANNPAVGNTEAYNFDALSNPSTEEDFATWGVPGMPKEKMEKMPTLPASAGLVGFAKGTEQLAGTNTPLAIDVKNKLSQGEREARLIAGNALMRGVAGFKNRLDDSKQMEGFYDNFSADNLYASDPSRDRGDYAESGLYRPDEQGQTWYGRSAQMGGYIDDDFEDGEEVYMTDEEIKEYMANGGQIEFI
jgi:hypothetical protein